MLGFLFSVGYTTRAVYNWFWARQIKLVILNTRSNLGVQLRSEPLHTHLLWGHFTHEIESPWPLHFKYSHWWKRRSRSKFTLQCARGTIRVSERTMDAKFTWMPTWHPIGSCFIFIGLFSKTAFGGRPNRKPGDHDNPLIHSIVSCVRPHSNRNSLKYHSIEGLVTYDFTLHSSH